LTTFLFFAVLLSYSVLILKTGVWAYCITILSTITEFLDDCPTALRLTIVTINYFPTIHGRPDDIHTLSVLVKVNLAAELYTYLLA
jgi:hypothetical protein